MYARMGQAYGYDIVCNTEGTCYPGPLMPGDIPAGVQTQILNARRAPSAVVQRGPFQPWVKPPKVIHRVKPSKVIHRHVVTGQFAPQVQPLPRGESIPTHAPEWKPPKIIHRQPPAPPVNPVELARCSGPYPCPMLTTRGLAHLDPGDVVLRLPAGDRSDAAFVRWVSPVRSEPSVEGYIRWQDLEPIDVPPDFHPRTDARMGQLSSVFQILQNAAQRVSSPGTKPPKVIHRTQKRYATCVDPRRCWMVFGTPRTPQERFSRVTGGNPTPGIPFDDLGTIRSLQTRFPGYGLGIVPRGTRVEIFPQVNGDFPGSDQWLLVRYTYPGGSVDGWVLGQSMSPL